MKRRRQESGFALLLVFLMAAVIAISLYMEIPRVVFEAQRQKEQLLIERGEQYKRAIQVFYTTNKRYPARIEELESLNNRRFLRRRYVDPMTGKDEWRLVHIQNGMLTDSVDTKQQQKKDDKDQSGNSGQYVAETSGIGQTPAPSAQSGANLVNRRRPSEGAAGGTMPGVSTNPIPDLPGGNQPPVPGAGIQPVQTASNGTVLPGQPGAPSVVPGQTGTPGGPPVPPGLPGIGVPGQPGVIPGQTSANTSGSNNQTGAGAYVGGGYSIGSQPTTTPNTPASAAAGPGSRVPGGVNAFPQQGQQPGVNPQAQNAAAAMIQQILTQPRPGGMPTAAPGAIGGGIAGVASNDDEDSIMVYNDHENYSQWEFLFDFTKYRPPPNPLQGVTGTPASQLGSMPGSPAGTPAGQTGTSPFGQSPTTPSPFAPSPTTPNPTTRQ